MCFKNALPDHETKIPQASKKTHNTETPLKSLSTALTLLS